MSDLYAASVSATVLRGASLMSFAAFKGGAEAAVNLSQSDMIMERYSQLPQAPAALHEAACTNQACCHTVIYCSQ